MRWNIPIFAQYEFNIDGCRSSMWIISRLLCSQNSNATDHTLIGQRAPKFFRPPSIATQSPVMSLALHEGMRNKWFVLHWQNVSVHMDLQDVNCKSQITNACTRQIYANDVRSQSQRIGHAHAHTHVLALNMTTRNLIACTHALHTHRHIDTHIKLLHSLFPKIKTPPSTRLHLELPPSEAPWDVTKQLSAESCCKDTQSLDNSIVRDYARTCAHVGCYELVLADASHQLNAEENYCTPLRSCHHVSMDN